MSLQPILLPPGGLFTFAALLFLAARLLRVRARWPALISVAVAYLASTPLVGETALSWHQTAPPLPAQALQPADAGGSSAVPRKGWTACPETRAVRRAAVLAADLVRRAIASTMSTPLGVWGWGATAPGDGTHRTIGASKPGAVTALGSGNTSLTQRAPPKWFV
jgi:hypothetical protein